MNIEAIAKLLRDIQREHGARCVAKLSLEDFMPRMGKGAR